MNNEDLYKLLRENPNEFWEYANKKGIEHCEMLLQVTKHSKRRDKILRELKWRRSLK